MEILAAIFVTGFVIALVLGGVRVLIYAFSDQARVDGRADGASRGFRDSP